MQQTRVPAVQRRTARPKQVLCTCKSYCTTLNPLTGRYKGNGSMQSRSTRDNHVRDDKQSQLVSEREGLPAMPTSSSTGEPARDRYTRINDEVDLLMVFPTTSFLRPLVFRYPPEENGEFIWPNHLDPPNHGVFALTSDAANRNFYQRRIDYLNFLQTSMRPMIIPRIREHCSIAFIWNSDA
jgi:hypothetical protein